jgi:hypothetical protein
MACWPQVRTEKMRPTSSCSFVDYILCEALGSQDVIDSRPIMSCAINNRTSSGAKIHTDHVLAMPGSLSMKQKAEQASAQQKREFFVDFDV